MIFEQVVQVATLASTIVAAAGLVIGVVVYRRQSNAQVFLEYTKRYQEIMDKWPAEARGARLQLDGEPPKESEELTLIVLRYLNLCSEEFYLCKVRYLSKSIWRIWQDELRRTLRSPLFRREWNRLKQEFESYPEFLAYVEQIQRGNV